MQFSCPQAFDTEQLADKLALGCPLGVVIYLHGDLGAGKSTFARAFIHALGFAGSVKSPTYTLLEAYRLADGLEALHMDLYRLADPEEVAYLGLDEYEKKTRVWLIEWPENGLGYIPRADVTVTFSFNEQGRNLNIQAQNAQALNWIANLDSTQI